MTRLTSSETLFAAARDLLGPDASFSSPDPHGLPLFVEPASPSLAGDKDAFVAWFRDRKTAFDTLLLRHGAVVLRGFPVPLTDDFARVIAHYPPHSQGYAAGGVARERIQGNIYEATRLPPHKWIMLHQEMAYLPRFPRLLTFYCRLPAAQRGETPVGDMRRLTAMIPTRFRDELERRGVAIARNFLSPEETDSPKNDPVFGHRSWKEAFYTDDRHKVEDDCRERGLDFQWLEDGSLTVTLRKEAFINHPATSERVWFNTVASNITHKRWMEEDWEAYAKVYPPGVPRPTHLTYGDGSPIGEDDYLLVHDIMDKMTVRFPWQAGDIMLVENILTAHGRSTFVPPRDIQVSLLD